MSFHIVTFRQIQALLLDTDIFLNWILMNKCFCICSCKQFTNKIFHFQLDKWSPLFKVDDRGLELFRESTAFSPSTKYSSNWIGHWMKRFFLLCSEIKTFFSPLFGRFMQTSAKFPSHSPKTYFITT